MFQTISMKQLEEMLERRSRAKTGNSGQNGNFVLLDVRSREEYEMGHLQGAVNLPYHELESLEYRQRSIPELMGYGPVVVYCGYGSHSMMAARILERMGYEVINTSGGLSYYRGRHFMRGPGTEII